MKILSKLIPNNLKEIIKILVNYIYPRNITCIICDNPIKLTNSYSLCKNCYKELHFILHRWHWVAIVGIAYDDLSKKLILDYKYSNKTYLCKYIAFFMKEKFLLEGIKADYILYVPLHKKRLKKRGFNQSERIARKLSELIDIPVLDCITRVKNTKKLYKMDKKHREKELINGFKVKDDIYLIKNKDVILIDDIFTTGSTVNEISKVLKINSVNNIYIFTLLTTYANVYTKE